MSTLSTNHRRVSDGGGAGSRGNGVGGRGSGGSSSSGSRVLSPGARGSSGGILYKVYTAEQTRTAGEIPFSSGSEVEAVDRVAVDASSPSEDVMTASITRMACSEEHGGTTRREVDGEESGTRITAEVTVEYDVGKRALLGEARTDAGILGHNVREGPTTGEGAGRAELCSRAVLRKPDGASNPSIPLSESPALPRKALTFTRKLSQSRSMEFQEGYSTSSTAAAARKKGLQETGRKSKSLVDRDTKHSPVKSNTVPTTVTTATNAVPTTVTTTTPNTNTTPSTVNTMTPKHKAVSKRDAVVNLGQDGVCVVSCLNQDSPYSTVENLASTCPPAAPHSPLAMRAPPTSHCAAKRSMLSRIGRFITSPARRSHARNSASSSPSPAPSTAITGVKLLKRPALVRNEDMPGYKATVVCVAQPIRDDGQDLGQGRVRGRGEAIGRPEMRETSGQASRRQQRPELRESSGYESFRNTDHTDASESADGGCYVICVI